MPVTALGRFAGSARPRAPSARLLLEPLEQRSLPSASPAFRTVLSELNQPNDTLDRAQPLGDLSLGGHVRVSGSVAHDTRADVDWYSFTLDGAASVSLRLTGLPGVLGLYNNARFDPQDPFNPLGNRLLAQVEGRSASLQRSLPAGTYFVAVSGAGNRYFHPFVADSGEDGATGSYNLKLTAASLHIAPSDGPRVLASDPAPDARIDRSPLILRVALTGLDDNSVLADGNVQLLDATGQSVPLQCVHFNTTAGELQVIPAAPLLPGPYQLVLVGNTDSGQPVLADSDGIPLGADKHHPAGQDYTLAFTVTGAEGRPTADPVSDDTPAHANELGDLTAVSSLQITGVIGDDPTDPTPYDPADVDLHHFRITGPGRYSFVAEVFAQRFGSPANTGASLFRLDPATGQLVLVAANDQSANPSTASNNNRIPALGNDAVLYAGLTEGDYYLAVTSGSNTPDPLLGHFPAQDGIFDPLVSQSGSSTAKPGPYAVRLQLAPDETAPQVAGVTQVAEGPQPGLPTRIVVNFSETIDPLKFALHASLRAAPEDRAIWIQGADGKVYFPRLESLQANNTQATFLLLDALPNGLNVLHISGSRGLTDVAGNPLAGNDDSGDYVTGFVVAHSDRGADGDPLRQVSREPNGDPVTAQQVGVLFRHELLAGVAIVRSPTAGTNPADSADYFRFQVLESLPYMFLLRETSLPGKLRLALFEEGGVPVRSVAQKDGVSRIATLPPGTYYLQITGWQPPDAAGLSYRIDVQLNQVPDNPPPLTLGPAPVQLVRLATDPAPGIGMPPPVPAPSGAPQANQFAGASASAGTPFADLVRLMWAKAAPAAGPGGTSPSPALAGLSADSVAAVRFGPVGGVATPASGGGAVAVIPDPAPPAPPPLAGIAPAPATASLDPLLPQEAPGAKIEPPAPDPTPVLVAGNRLGQEVHNAVFLAPLRGADPAPLLDWFLAGVTALVGFTFGYDRRDLRPGGRRSFWCETGDDHGPG